MTDPRAETALVDAVLLIDGDNDPHLPPDYPIGDRTLVRVFLRTDGKIPRGLERLLGERPHLVGVYSPKGGANAADFVMSLHCGMLHATLPMHIPFTLVTNDKSLAVMVQELQRLGRQAVLWTSHEARAAGGRGAGRGRSAAAAKPAAGPSAAVHKEGGRSRRGRRDGRGRSRPAAAAAPAALPAPDINGTAAPEAHEGSLAAAAAAYARRLAKVKDPPSRLKALLNDIKNRTIGSGQPPEAILEELKRSHGILVDANGKVTVPGRS